MINRVGLPIVSPQHAAWSRRRLLEQVALGAGLAAAGLALSACGSSGGAAGSAATTAAGSATVASAGAPATASAASGATSMSSASAAPAVAAGASRAAGTIQWSTWNTGGLLTSDQGWINAFQKANPDVKVSVINSPTDYAAKLLSQAAAGALPDVMHLAADYYPSLVQAKLLLDVTSYFDQSHFDATKYLPFSNIFKPGGRIMGGLEDYSKDYPLFYNATMFQDAKLPTPYDLYQQGKWTWDAFTTSAGALTKNGVYGANSYNLWETGWSPWLYAAGATDWITPKADLSATMKLDSAGVKQATEFLVGLIYDKKVAPKPGTITTVGGADAFTAGKVAMMTNGNWVMVDYPKLIGTRFQWGIAPVPTPTGSKYQSMFNPGAHGMVSAHTKQPEAAVALAQFFLGDTVQSSLAQNPTLLPMLRSAYTAAASAKVAEQHFDVTQYLIEHSSPIPVFLKFDQSVAKIQSDLDNAFLGKVSADQALTSAQQDAQQIAAGTGS
jgi:multiple sugar transport system substrate-binding protein